VIQDKGIFMAKKQFYLTEEGIRDLKAEIEMHVQGRSVISEAIRVAREQGDLSENAEYHAAKQEQERAEVRISEIEHILKNVAVIKAPKADGKIVLGSHVSLKSEAGKVKEFQLVGTVESDPLNGKISNESPIGVAVLGKKQGEEVEITTPAETVTYIIVSIS
jgi:transcription elongation factor GreA